MIFLPVSQLVVWLIYFILRGPVGIRGILSVDFDSYNIVSFKLGCFGKFLGRCFLFTLQDEGGCFPYTYAHRRLQSPASSSFGGDPPTNKC